MPSVRDLRDRIKSLKNTQQITKAMKQVAAAKIRRAESVRKQARPYADAIGAMLRDLIASVGVVDHPFMKPGASGAPRGIVLMTADKGLAGAFNANLVRQAELAQALGRVLHRPARLPTPGFAVRLLLGGAAEMVLTGQRVLPVAALHSGYEFKYPELEPALRSLLA